MYDVSDKSNERGYTINLYQLYTLVFGVPYIHVLII